MQLRKFVFISIPLLLFLMMGEVKAQTTKDVGRAPAVPAPQYQASKQEKGFFAFFGRIFGKKQQGPQYMDPKDSKRRMRKLRKKQRREARMASKPQYNDPLYFGHKRPPKKRPLGKRKFCEVCQIKH
jgi:hypothetical protein